MREILFVPEKSSWKQTTGGGFSLCKNQKGKPEARTETSSLRDV